MNKDDLDESPRLKLCELRETPLEDNPEPSQVKESPRHYGRRPKPQKAHPGLYPQGYFKPKGCKRCGEEFRPNSPSHLYCSPECVEVATASAYLRRNYGITYEDYEQIFSKQGGKCAICKGDGFVMNPEIHNIQLVVDHCHNTSEVRGLLCHNCNRGLGLFKDDQSVIKTALEYLEGATTIPKGSRT